MRAGKIFIGLLLVVAILPFPAWSQVDLLVHEQAIDSLENLVAELPQGEEKVEVLNEYARYCFFGGRLQEALLSLKEASDLTDELNYLEGKRMYFITLSIINNDESAAAYYRKKAEWLVERTDEDLPTKEQYSRQTFPDSTLVLREIEQLRRLLAEFADVKDKEIRANVYTNIALFYYSLAEFELARQQLAEASKIFAEIGELFPVILLSRYQIAILRASNRAEQAREIELYLVDLVASSKNINKLHYITSAMGDNYASTGRFALAIEYYLESLEEAERVGDYELLANLQLDLGTSYESINLNKKAVDHYSKGIELGRQIGDSTLLSYANGIIVFPYIALEEFDSALKHLELFMRDTTYLDEGDISINYYHARYFDAQGQLLMGQGKYIEATRNFNKSYEYFSSVDGFDWAKPYIKLYLTECYLNIGQLEIALEHGLSSLELTIEPRVTTRASLLVSEIYMQMNELQLAYNYLKRHVEIRAESDRLDELNRLADAEIRTIIEKSQIQIDNLEQDQLKSEQERKVQELWIFSIAGALVSAIILALVLYRNNKNKQKANTLLKKQKLELQTTLDQLEATQNQLIHSEKMASLGELTAGIAHEIQNPLNFVNNFSDVSEELVDELQEEANAGNIDEVKEIATDLKDNLGKIHHHGERASSIVKGMLQHSRTGSGENELTDLNAMVDEYLRLAYHGLRAKDKSFNADFNLELDEDLPKVNIVPQDIGRVLLNLINNAFHACAEHGRSADSGYKPLVTVSTKFVDSPLGAGGSVQITVSDNGPGIPDEIKDKIFQPFFTTKAAGEGTGLGLSMSYDIITKGHGGRLKVESTPGKGTKFIIELSDKSETKPNS